VRFEADAASAEFSAGVQFGPAGEDPSPCPVVRHRPTVEEVTANTSLFGSPQAVDTLTSRADGGAGDGRLDIAKNLLGWRLRES